LGENIKTIGIIIEAEECNDYIACKSWSNHSTKNQFLKFKSTEKN